MAPGYTARVLIAWGDPVSDGPAFKQDASNSAADQAQQWGMHNDGLVYFPIRRSSREGLIVQNSEYTDDGLLFPDGQANWTAEKTAKSQNAHGVNIIHVRRGRGNDRTWEVVRPSPYARRITGQTPMTIGGPVGGDPTTSGRPPTRTGRRCSARSTTARWGTRRGGRTSLARRTSTGTSARTVRRPTSNVATASTPAGAGYLWHTTDARFRTDEEPNEPNRFGWVVEIDPFDPESTPVKRTALGRIKHEGAWVQETRDGRVVVYTGDDEQFEYIYRYVSNLPWKRAQRQGIDPLDDGVLYVAKFLADGWGEWLPLTPDNPALAGWSLNDILINTRGAADVVGATPMDRPEWIDTFPEHLTAIATLTNNTARGTTTTNPRSGLHRTRCPTPPTRGHRTRTGTSSAGPTSTTSTSRCSTGTSSPSPVIPPCRRTGSTIVGDKYGSPDGIYVAPSGRLWIQTDVSASTINSGAYAGFGNNQMLAADPTTKETRRFLVGPNSCEITGAMATPDERTMFVGIQHPGEGPSGNHSNPANPKAFSSWPDGPAGGRPRSALLVITKDDGGKIGT